MQIKPTQNTIGVDSQTPAFCILLSEHHNFILPVHLLQEYERQHRVGAEPTSSREHVIKKMLETQ